MTDGGRAIFDRFLVPFELPDADLVAPALAEWLSDSHVAVLGYYAVPPQTPPELLRRQAEPDAEKELARLREPFERRGASVETRLVFGRERAEMIDNIAREAACGVELVPAPVEAIDRILVPLRSTDPVHLSAGILAHAEGRVTLFHVAEDDASRAIVETKLEQARGRLSNAYETTVTTAAGTGRHREAIVETAELYDLVVMGETDAGLTERIFGPLPVRIVEDAKTPVFVVRSDRG